MCVGPLCCESCEGLRGGGGRRWRQQRAAEHRARASAHALPHSMIAVAYCRVIARSPCWPGAAPARAPGARPRPLCATGTPHQATARCATARGGPLGQGPRRGHVPRRTCTAAAGRDARCVCCASGCRCWQALCRCMHCCAGLCGLCGLCGAVRNMLLPASRTLQSGCMGRDEPVPSIRASVSQQRCSTRVGHHQHVAGGRMYQHYQHHSLRVSSLLYVLHIPDV
jgi:hypothetical protein